MNKGLIFNGFSEFNITAERPSGAYRIAHYLRECNWDIEVIDYIMHWDFEKIEELLRSRKNIKFIGISATWIVNAPGLDKLCSYIKSNYPEIVLVIGGNGILYSTAQADYFITNYGERAIKAVLDYEFGTAQKPFGKPFRSGWHIDALHFYPAWPSENYHIDYEDRDFIQPTDVLSIELSRGCKFQCKFCSFPILGVKEDNSVSEQYIKNTLTDYYNKWGVKNYLIADETTNDRTVKLEKLSNAVSKCNFNPNFNGFVRVDLLKSHPEHVDLLIGARMWGHYYGVETFNHSAGKVIGKGMNPATIKELLLTNKNKFQKNLGLYRGTIGLIAGLPYETLDDLKDTHEWLVNNWSDQSWHMWNLTIPKIDGKLLPSKFTFDYEKYGYSEMTQEEIDRGQELLKARGDVVLVFDRHEVFWKNKNGSYFDFLEASEKYAGKHNIRMIDNYSIWSRLSLGIPLEDAILEKIQFEKPAAYERLMKIVKEYSDKKLSL